MREITGDSAAELAEWWSIAYDLDHVIAATKELLSQFDKGEENSTLKRALWTSALIAYGRCFTTGLRKKLDPEIYRELQGQPLETHKYYKDTRDKHIAHPVNNFEEIKIGVFADPSRGITGIGHLHAFQISNDRQGVQQLGLLATVALKHVRSTINRLQASILENWQKRPLEEVAKLPIVRVQPQGGAEAARTQKPTPRKT